MIIITDAIIVKSFCEPEATLQQKISKLPSRVLLRYNIIQVDMLTYLFILSIHTTFKISSIELYLLYQERQTTITYKQPTLDIARENKISATRKHLCGVPLGTNKSIHHSKLLSITQV